MIISKVSPMRSHSIATEGCMAAVLYPELTAKLNEAMEEGVDILRHPSKMAEAISGDKEDRQGARKSALRG